MKAEVQSLQQRQTGHVIRMTDEQLSKKLFWRTLWEEGSIYGGQKKRCKDTPQGLTEEYHRLHRTEYQENMSVKCIPPYTPLLHSTTGFCRGLSIFLIFGPKQVAGTR